MEFNISEVKCGMFIVGWVWLYCYRLELLISTLLRALNPQNRVWGYVRNLLDYNQSQNILNAAFIVQEARNFKI